MYKFGEIDLDKFHVRGIIPLNNRIVAEIRTPQSGYGGTDQLGLTPDVIRSGYFQSRARQLTP